MSGLYANARTLFLTSGLNWNTGTFGALLATGGYIPNLASDQHVSDIPPVAILARQPLSSLSAASNGAAQASNATFPAVAGAPILYIVIYQNTGTDATSALVCEIDTAAGLPAFPSGTPVTVIWDTGPYKIFLL